MASNQTLLCVFTEKAGEINCNGTIFYSDFSVSEEGEILPTNWMFWLYLSLYIFLVLFAGLMSGLTIGLLSLDILSLQVLKKSGKPQQQKYASRILTLVKRHHLLLVTLLLANAVAVESMPIFLDKITNEIVAILISVTAVLLFGEIIPQALCTRFGLAIGYYCAPLVYVLMVMLFIIAFPIAKFLDCILGRGHGTFFRRAELKELVQLHGGGEIKKGEDTEPLSDDEVLIVKSALEMRDKTVKNAMTPLESVFMLDINDSLGNVTMDKINLAGYSRVPVYEGTKDNITGILLVKKLIKLDPDDNVAIRDIEGATIRPPSCSIDTPLFDILNMFQTGRSHLYLVYDESADQLVGIITLEDVIEEIIGEEIVDETDVYIDVHKRITVARARIQSYRCQRSDPTTTTGRTGGTKFTINNKKRNWIAEDIAPVTLTLGRQVGVERATSANITTAPDPSQQQGLRDTTASDAAPDPSLQQGLDDITTSDTAPLLLEAIN